MSQGKKKIPDYEGKPQLSRAQQEAKARREAGVCGLIRDQKDRIERNRKRREGVDFGSNGPSGRKIVRDMMRSPEAMWMLAFLFTAGNAFREMGYGLGRSIGDLFSRSSGSSGSSETESAGGGGTIATISATSPVVRQETPGSHLSRSAASKQRGDRVRQRLVREMSLRFGPKWQPDGYLKPVTDGEHSEAYDRLAVMLLTKQVGDNAEWRELEQIGRFHSDLQTFLWRSNRGDMLLDEMHKLVKIAMQQGEDRADAIDRVMPLLLERVEKWKSGDGSRFFSPAPTLEQGGEAGDSEVTMPGPGAGKSAPKPDDDDYQSPAPGAR